MEINKGEGAVLGKEFFCEEEPGYLIEEEEEKELLEFISSGNLEIDRRLEGVFLQVHSASWKVQMTVANLFSAADNMGALNQDKTVLF